jgi:hypothetical protein
VKLARANRGPANRAEAWACLTANLALPGSGSLAAGKSIGYFQLALTVVGFLLTVVAGIGFIQWMLANWTAMHDPTGDPFETLAGMWQHGRWAFAGIIVWAFSLLWAGITGLQILAAFPKNPVPPKIV